MLARGAAGSTMERAHQVLAPRIAWGRCGLAAGPQHCGLVARVVTLDVSREQFLEALEFVELVGLDLQVQSIRAGLKHAAPPTEIDASARLRPVDLYPQLRVFRRPVLELSTELCKPFTGLRCLQVGFTEHRHRLTMVGMRPA